MGKALEITDSNFEQEVLKEKLPVLVDFWATWCGPCLMMAPIVEEIAQEYTGRLKVTKLDVDQNNQTSIQYGIRSIPTLFFFKDGKVVDRIVGPVPKQNLVEKIEKVLNS